MGKRVVEDGSLAGVAGTIRAKTGKANKLVFPEGFSAGVEDVFAAGRAEAENELLEYDNDKVTTITPFSFCKSKLRRISLPNLKESTGGSVFTKCENLKHVGLPNYSGGEGNGYFFDGDTSLQFVDFGSPESISKCAFRNCTSLCTVVLRGSSAAVLINTNAFDGVSHVMIYVPSALVNQYESATNWGALCASGKVEFVKLEGSEYV